MGLKKGFKKFGKSVKKIAKKIEQPIEKKILKPGVKGATNIIKGTGKGIKKFGKTVKSAEKTVETGVKGIVGFTSQLGQNVLGLTDPNNLLLLAGIAVVVFIVLQKKK